MALVIVTAVFPVGHLQMVVHPEANRHADGGRHGDDDPFDHSRFGGAAAARRRIV